MEFGVLGPVTVRDGGRELPLGGPKQRALLAILLLRANEVVSRDRLVDGLWGERPPPTAAHTLDNYMSRLRKTLGEGRLERRPPGYALQVEPEELDLDRFEQLRALAREELARGEMALAAEKLRSALELWRGPALGDVLYEPFAAEEAERLEERRVSALEERIEADLALGMSTEVVPELEALVRAHPFRERLLAQLMLALYRAGRQADALSAYQAGRRQLAEGLGLEPGPELRELQRTILEHDPSLAAPTTRRRASRTPARRSRSTLAAVAVAVAAVAVSAAVGIALGIGGSSASSTESTSSQLVGLSLDSGALSERASLTSAPAAVAAQNGSLWIADPSAGTVTNFDLATQAVVDQVRVGGSPGGLVEAAGSIWVVSVPGESVSRVDPETGTITDTLALGRARASALAARGRSLWIADITDNALIELDVATGSRRRVPLELRPTALAIGDEAIWAADYGASSIAHVDVRTGRTVATVRVGNGPVALAATRTALWVANSLDSTVSRIDPISGSVVATIPVGSGPRALAASADAIWVANEYSGTVSRIDSSRNTVAETVDVGAGPTTLTVADGTVWVGARPLGQHPGGTLILLSTRSISIDPALHLNLFPLQSDGLTRDGLVTLRHAPGPAGTQLVPDLALGLPLPTDGGKTYTFRLRPGIPYSDGRFVRAGDFRRAIERVFRLQSDGRDLFAMLVGATTCLESAGMACDLSRGIVTDDRAGTVTFHLREPDPNFLVNLTVGGLASPVPPGTPWREVGVDPIPGTGPYMIESASAEEIRYVRNPYFREWSHAAQPDGNPDKIVMRFGLTPEEEVREIQAGRADWSADLVPARLLPELETRFAAQLHNHPTTETDFFQLNETQPPFDDVRVRRALNFAIDRDAVVRIYGGSEAASPSCQVLPPGVRGYRPYCPYTKDPRPAGVWRAPDLARAKRLVEASGTRGSRVTVWGYTDDATISPRVSRYTAGVLRRLGYRVRVRLIPHSFAGVTASEFSSIQLITGAWLDTSAYSFIAPWHTCGGAINHGWFCRPRLDREMRRANSLEAADPRAAAKLWARIDRELVDEAPWVPLVNPRLIDFVSARAGNYQVHPYWGIIASQLWIE